MAIHTADRNTFHDMISTDFVIVDFYGSTCTPCKVFSKILEDIEAESPFLNIVKLNTTDNPEIATEYQISAVPTIQFYRDGKLLESHVGVMQPAEVKAAVARYMYE